MDCIKTLVIDRCAVKAVGQLGDGGHSRLFAESAISSCSF